MIGQKTKPACDEPGILQLSCLQIIGATARVKINTGSKSAIFDMLSQISAFRDQFMSVLRCKTVELPGMGAEKSDAIHLPLGAQFRSTLGTKTEELRQSGWDACSWIYRGKVREAIT